MKSILSALPVLVPVLLAMIPTPAMAQHAAKATSSDPVVLEGKRLPTLLGKAPGTIVAFAFRDEKWRQIPVQIDERAKLKFGKVLGRRISRDLEGVFYTDPKTHCGADPDPGFDADDELVFLLADCAGAGPASAPSGVRPDSRVELRIATAAKGADKAVFAYLFESLGDGEGTDSSRLDPAAGRDDVRYEFRLKSGNYKKTYKLGHGGNPEESSITTSAYRLGFSDRWILDELRLRQDASLGIDILDGHMVELVPGNCLRTTKTFSDGPGSIIANIDGPVRAIRSVVGANSGPLTERLWICYARRFDIISHLRVHALPSMFMFFDYSKDAVGMRYFDNNNFEGESKNGAIIDGKPDAIHLGELHWQLVTGAPGSLLIHYILNTDIDGMKTSSRYNDAENPKWKQCLGDAHAFAASGMLLGRIPNTDRRLGPAARLSSRIVIYPGAPNMKPADLGAITKPLPPQVEVR